MFLACSTRTMANARQIVREAPEPRYAPPRLVEARKRQTPPQHALAPLQRPVLTPADELRRIIELVARMHGATYAEVISKTRKRRVVWARVAAIGAVKNIRPGIKDERRGISLPALGRLFGNRDHTTILWALTKWEGRK